jgi:hypothetical protein
MQPSYQRLGGKLAETGRPFKRRSHFHCIGLMCRHQTGRMIVLIVVATLGLLGMFVLALCRSAAIADSVSGGR